MKRLANVAPVLLLALCLASTSWAGGRACSRDGAKTKATTAGAGVRCDGKDASAAVAHKECGVKANQVMYSFAVPSVECDHCIENIQKSAMAKNGIACAHVDLTTHTAYIIADRKISQKDISKLIAKAGYKNTFSGKGDKVQAAFAKAVATGEKSVACCAKSKDRV